MITPAEAERLILANVPPFPVEDCPIGEAQGRVLRAAFKADRDIPPFDRVILDGYALCAAALAAGGRAFRVEGIQAAGTAPSQLGPADDACIEVMTGAVLSTGADCVVPYEDTVREGAVMTVGPGILLAPGHAVHRRGSDHRAGEIILSPGTRLTGREIAVAAACGGAVLPVSRVPRIAIVATGDELVEVEAMVAAHQIRRSNDYALRAALAAAGFSNVERFHLRDRREEIEPLLSRLIAGFDVILLTGGVSKGKFDFLPAELDRQGVRMIFHGIAQRPGKPFWFGLSPRTTPIFALPGNPVSAYTCFHRYVLPALMHASGLAPPPARFVALAAAVTFKPNLARLLPVKLSSGPRAELLATGAGGNTSGDFAGLIGTDGFVELPAGQDEFPVGYIARFWQWT